MSRKDVWVIGLIGDVCAGKSAAAAALAELGAWLFDADERVHLLLRQPDVKGEIRLAFLPASVFGLDGEIDRRALAQIVFSDPEEMAKLGNILYPRVRAIIEKELSEAEKGSVLVLDAPTLLESGNKDLVDVVLFIAAPLETRRAWAAARGWTKDELDRRTKLLRPREERLAASDWVICNDGTLEDLRTQVLAFWEDHSWR
jgi:dephospho-CoA kinase